MSSSPTDTTSEFEFNESQNQLIGSLARKMALVGFVMTFFGLLQLINGVTSLFLARNPERVIAAASSSRLACRRNNWRIERGIVWWLLVLAGHRFCHCVGPGRNTAILGRPVDATGRGRIRRNCAHQGERYFTADGRTGSATSEVWLDLFRFVGGGDGQLGVARAQPLAFLARRLTAQPTTLWLYLHGWIDDAPQTR